jgi:signal transduction histidine kinase
MIDDAAVALLIKNAGTVLGELAGEIGKILISNVEPHELLKSLALIVAKSLNAVFVTIKLEYAILKLESQRFTYGVIDSSLKDYLEQLEHSAIKLLRAVSYKNSAPDQFESDLRFNLFSAPITSKDRVLGTITICGEKTTQPYTLEEDGQYVVNTIANYISSGLENTLLNIRLKDVVRELTDAQKRLIEQEKFRSLGEMTANIAHEIKNPLVIIGGFAKRLAKKMQSEGAEDKYLDIILKEVNRLEIILNEILHYVKESPAISEACNINEFLDDILYLLTSDASWDKVDITKQYDSELPLIPCDSQQLKQVFINILMNAHEAMNGHGSLTVKTARVMYNNRTFISASITDTGGGINPAIIDNIFNPFFTTKEQGSGLGLAISHKIITNHRGHISVENSVGKGVTFIVYLPLKNNLKEEFL